MGAAIKSTARGTNNILSNKIVIDMSDRISMLQPSAAPLTVLTKKLSTEACSNYKYEWMEDDLMARWVNVAVAVADGVATTFTLDGTSTLAVDDLLKNPLSGEVIRVAGITNATQITVQRAYGETAGAAIPLNTKLLLVGNAIMQGDSAPGEKYTVEGVVYNYTQIFRTPFSVTNTLDSIKLYGGKEFARQRVKKGIEHKMSIEYAALFGERKLDLTGAQPRTTTGGVVKFLSGTQNVFSKSSATVTENDLIDWCEQLFQYGSDTRVMLSSPKFITLLNKWVASNNKIQVDVGQETFGIRVMTYFTPHGTLKLIKHPLFVNGYSGYNIALDMSELKYRPLQGRDTKLKTNIQAADEDGQRDEYITEAGFELRQPKKHGMFILT